MATQAGAVEIVMKLNAANYSAGMQKVNAQLKALDQTNRKVAHGAVQPWMASSAAIRLVSGDITNNIRAAERFVATMPMVQKAVLAAFPAVGVIALGGVVLRLTSRFEEAAQAADELQDKIKNSWAKLDTSGMAANDALAVTNDKLEAQIALLEGQRPNNLKTELDEAREAADKLAQSLLADNDRMNQLMKENHSGAFNAFWNNEATTTAVEKHINDFNQRLARLGVQKSLALSQGDTAGATRIQGQIAATEQYGVKWSQKYIDEGNWINRWSHLTSGFIQRQDNNIADLQGFQLKMREDLRAQQERKRNSADQGKLIDLKQKKEIAAKAAEAARRAQEAARRAIAAEEKLWTDGLVRLKAEQARSVEYEADFWEKRAAEVRKGSELYVFARRHANAIEAQMRSTGTKEASTWASLQTVKPEDLSKGFHAGSSDRTDVEWLKNLNDGVAIQRANADAIAQASLQMQIATGKISAYSAAVAQADLNTRQYQEALTSLEYALANAPDRAVAAGLRNQIAQLNGQRAMQMMRDQQNVVFSTPSGASRAAIDQMVASWTDMTQQLASLLPESIDGVNQSLSHALMAHARTGYEYRRGIEQGLSNTARGIGAHVLNMGIQHMEGSVLGHFGFGPKSKPDGTRGNPLWVSVLEGQAGGGSQSAASLLAMMAKPSGLSTVTKGVTSLLPSLLSVIPGFASGGELRSGLPAIVGEQGPELFVPSTSGRIVPNHELGFGETHVHHAVHVDARGSTDPAAVEASVHRAMSEWAPRIVGASVHAVREQRARVPSMKR